MINKPILAIDCDGVLADWMGYVIPIFNTLFNRNISLKDLNDWDLFTLAESPDDKKILWDYLNSSNMIRDMRPYGDAVNIFPNIHKFAEVYVVTSPMMDYPKWIIHRNNWLKTYFDVDEKHVIHTPAKQLIEADVFVDDKPSNVIKWKEKHPWGNQNAILWKHEHVKVDLKDLDIIHTNDWKVIIELLESKGIPF